jgi:hypothetical protein
MPRIFLLISYPKSGNTWLRALLESLRSGGAPIDINDMGSGVVPRLRFDALLSVESSSLTPAEIAEARPAFMRLWAAENPDQAIFAKAHEANLPFPGTGAAPYPPETISAAIHIVRDPRDVAVSLASHLGRSVNEVIATMADPCQTVSRQRVHLSDQMPQLVSTWTAHARSWLGAPGFRIMTIRYEDLAADTPAQLAGIAGFLGLDSNHDAIARAVEAADFQNLQRQEAASGFRERPEGMPRFFRRGRAGGWRDSLTPLQAARIEQDHGELMDSLNYVRIRTFSAG